MFDVRFVSLSGLLLKVVCGVVTPPVCVGDNATVEGPLFWSGEKDRGEGCGTNSFGNNLHLRVCAGSMYVCMYWVFRGQTLSGKHGWKTRVGVVL